MKVDEIKSIFKAFQPVLSNFEVEPIKSGHINQTFLVYNGENQFLLQKLNTTVFKNMEAIMQNMQAVSDHLQQKNYPHKILSPLSFKNKETLFDGQWRLFPFFKRTQTFEKVQSAEQPFAAAQFLSEFHFYLRDFVSDKIQDSIPGFLDFKSRSEQFDSALKSAAEDRIKQAAKEIEYIHSQRSILDKWNGIHAKLPKRLIHADPKISNFLFDQDSTEEIVALIDWDTLMNGTILYDFGDMVRSYTNLREEDDPEIGGNFSLENYKALKKGFLFHLEDTLTPQEINHLDLAGKAVIYVQALRFLSDYLQGDKYYAVRYPNQNLNRTKNQLNLLKELLDAKALTNAGK